MIEVISTTRCTGCNICVTACPTNVFDIVRGQPPRIARQDDCQTCFMCELYCPVDALYVAPDPEHKRPLKADAAEVERSLGSYRQAIGWGRKAATAAPADPTFELLLRAH